MKNYAAWEVPIVSDVNSLNDKEFLRYLVEWGVLAANSHNSQPWKFLLNPPELEIEIFLDRSRVLPVSDPRGRQAEISIGCLIGNIQMAAEAYGCDFVLEYGNLVKLRIIRHRQNSLLNDSGCRLLTAIKERRMHRGFYREKQTLPSGLLKEFSDFAENNFIFCDDLSGFWTKRLMSELQAIADRKVLEMPDFRKELSEWILLNGSQSFLGMPGSTLGMDDKTIMALNPAGRKIFRSAPFIGVLSVPRDTLVWRLRTGSSLQKILVTAQQSGLACSVHAALVEVSFFSYLLRLRLFFRSRKIRIPLAVFRVGYPAEEKRPHSPRIPAELLIEYK